MTGAGFLVKPWKKESRSNAKIAMITQNDQDSSRVILLAEDRDDDSMLIQLAFQKTGLPHLLFQVGTGNEVVDYLEGARSFSNRSRFPSPDLLLLDLKMPRMDGFDVLAWLRQTPEKAGLPVVVLSGSDRAEDKAMAVKLGARDYYVKSADPQQTKSQLLEICSRWLDQNSLAT